MDIKSGTKNNLNIGGGIQLLVDAADVVDVSNFENDVVVIITENVHHTSSVPVVSYSTTVVDMTGSVHKNLQQDGADYSARVVLYL